MFAAFQYLVPLKKRIRQQVNPFLVLGKDWKSLHVGLGVKLPLATASGHHVRPLHGIEKHEQKLAPSFPRRDAKEFSV
jgi:hypothetical protein